MVEQPLDLHRGWSQRRQFLRLVLKIHGTFIVVPPDNTTVAYSSLQMSTTEVHLVPEHLHV